MASASPSPIRPPFTGQQFTNPNVSLSGYQYSLPRVEKTAVNAFAPLYSQVGPNMITADTDTRICFDTTYGKEERICSPPNPSFINGPLVSETVFLNLIDGFINAVCFKQFEKAISFTSPELRETWNGPQQISNLSNFQEYLYNSMSPLKFLSIVKQWKSKSIQIMPSIAFARIQVETIDIYGTSHGFVFEFSRNTKFDTFLVTSPKMEWKISKVYPSFGDMDEFF